MRPWFCLVATGLLASCASERDPLVVKQFTLREQTVDRGEDPMVRAEKQRRLHGAVSMAERRDLLGQYYTVLWSENSTGEGPVVVRFEYQQGATASRVLESTQTFDSADTAGKAEFSVIGDNYFQKGRVLAWKATLTRGGREISTKKSYLWE